MHRTGDIMNGLKTHLFTCLGDNYGVLVHDPDTGATASIDEADDAVVQQFIHGRADGPIEIENRQ